MNSPVWSLLSPECVPVAANPLPSSADVVVVGAGLTGLSCAYHLLAVNPGLSVVVLDARHPGSGASGQTTGMVTPGVGQDFAALVRRLGLDRAGSLYAETREAVKQVGAIVAAEGINCDHEQVGQLVVAHGEHGEARLLRQAAALKAAGQPCIPLDAAGLAARVNLSGIGNIPATAALFLPDAAMVDPLKLVRGLVRVIEARGGCVQGGASVETLTDGAEPVLHLAGGRNLKAGKIVLATAWQAPRLASLTGRIIPLSLKVLATAPLSVAQLAVLGWSGRECIVDSRKLFNYFRLTSDNRIVFGGGSPAYGPDATPDFSDLARELRERLPTGVEPAISHRWSGTIDYTLDGQPIVGPVLSSGNVFHAGGFCGHGIALGMRAGRWVAEAIAAAPGRSFHHAAFRDTAPLVPGEWLRRSCFAIASGWMRLRGV
ncbi:MAG: FAD-dependent oxidoreductase [Usitatibacter sp.]